MEVNGTFLAQEMDRGRIWYHIKNIKVIESIWLLIFDISKPLPPIKLSSSFFHLKSLFVFLCGKIMNTSNNHLAFKGLRSWQ